MKLVIAIIQGKDEEALLNSFVKNNLMATRIASQGGFLREKNVTLYLGVENDQTELVINLIRENCSERTVRKIEYDHAEMWSGLPFAFPIEVHEGGATVFIIRTEQAFKF